MNKPSTLAEVVADRIKHKPRLARNLEGLTRAVNGYTYPVTTTQTGVTRPAAFVALEADLKARILDAVRIVSPTLTDAELWASVTTKTPKEFGIVAKQRMGERISQADKNGAFLAIDELTMLFLENSGMVDAGMFDYRDPRFASPVQDVTTTTRTLWVGENGGEVTRAQVKEAI